MALFGKKKEELGMPSGPPVDRVIAMRQQGLTNNQIVQALQREGHKSSDIFDAMSQADIKGGIEPAPPPSYTPPEKPAEMPAYPPTIPTASQGATKEEVEELVEAIIEEKWAELSKNISKIVEWKNDVESKISAIEQKIKDLKTDFDNLHQAIIGKIGEYDQNILNVGTDLKAMEKVFQKILPTFTENINELSRITKGLKEAKKK